MEPYVAMAEYLWFSGQFGYDWAQPQCTYYNRRFGSVAGVWSNGNGLPNFTSGKSPFTGSLNDSGHTAGVDKWSDWGYKNYDSNFNKVDPVQPRAHMD